MCQNVLSPKMCFLALVVNMQLRFTLKGHMLF